MTDKLFSAQEQERFDDMVLGYIDGLDADALTPGANRSAAYYHGWLNGRDDMNKKPRASAGSLRETADKIIADDDGRWWCDRCKEYYTPRAQERDYRCPHCLR